MLLIIFSVECLKQYNEGTGKCTETCKKKMYLDDATNF